MRLSHERHTLILHHHDPLTSDIHYFSHVLPVAILTAIFAPVTIALLLKAMNLKTFSREEGKTF